MKEVKIIANHIHWLASHYPEVRQPFPCYKLTVVQKGEVCPPKWQGGRLRPALGQVLRTHTILLAPVLIRVGLRATHLILWLQPPAAQR